MPLYKSFASPPAIGNTTPNTGAFTTISASTDGSAATPAITRSSDNNTGIFFPAADTIAFSEGGTEAMRIDSSGRVGIGTSSPLGLLDVAGTGTTAQHFIRTTGSGNTNVALRILDGSTGTEGTSGLYLGRTGGSAINWLWTYENEPWVFGTSATERMRIDSSGNVGVGTTSPRGRLEVVGSQCILSSIIAGRGGNAYPTIAYNADYRDATNNTTGVKYLVGDTISQLDTESGQFIFRNAPAGSAGATATLTERLRITSGGNVGIGMTPTAQLELSTDSAKKPSTNTWTIASDERLKTNIVEADKDRCYEIVKEVPLKRYTWKSEVYSQEQVKDRSKLGWIAQDVEAVFPKAVGTNRFAYNQVFEDVVTPEVDSDGNPVLDEDGNPKTKTEKRLVSEDVIEDCKDLNSDQIYAVMYGTIQKLIEKVESLESKVAALEAA